MININDYTDEKGRFDSRYLLIRPLSTDGATADVWLALDLNTVSMTDGEKLDQISRLTDVEIDKLGLMVAIKIYRPQNALDIEGEQRFRDEYMIVFNCHHANLIHPTNFSIYKDVPYLVLPYCKRGSSELLIGNEFSSEDTWKYILDVSSGLAYLHALKPPIVHQDVKPANVLMDDTGNYALTDFGISAQRGGVHGYYFDEENSGTLAYMAPERFQKDVEPMPQSDIWGFGATLCEVLTGKVPFGEEGGKNQADGQHPMPQLHGLSADVQRLIHDCLSLQPGDRPSAQQIADAARARQYPMKSHKGLWITLAALAASLIAVGVVYLMTNNKVVYSEASISVQEQFDYARNLMDHYYGKVDSVQKGAVLLDSLSKLKYVPAQLEYAVTIGPNFTNEQSSNLTQQRKKYLNIECEPDLVNWPSDRSYLNQSIDILENLLAQNDSSFAKENYHAAFNLGRIYGQSIFHGNKPNYEKIIECFDKALTWAQYLGEKKLINNAEKAKKEALAAQGKRNVQN